MKPRSTVFVYYNRDILKTFRSTIKPIKIFSIFLKLGTILYYILYYNRYFTCMCTIVYYDIHWINLCSRSQTTLCKRKKKKQKSRSFSIFSLCLNSSWNLTVDSISVLRKFKNLVQGLKNEKHFQLNIKF